MSPESFEPHATQLTDAWLTRARVAENPDFDSELLQRVSYGVETDTAVDLSGKLPQAELSLSIHWLDAEGNETDGPFDVEVTVVGEFDAGPFDDEDRLRTWLQFSATHLLWPYARTYVSALTGFTRYMPLTLFTVQVPRPRALDPDTSEFEASSG